MQKHTDIITRQDLKELSNHFEKPCISVIIPTSPVDTSQSQIHFANALHEIEKKIAESKASSGLLNEQLSKLKVLKQDSTFWSFQGHSLCIFISPTIFRMFRIPISLEYKVDLGMFFYLSPLHQTLQENRIFYILSISQNTSKLYSATRDSISNILFRPLPTMDQSLFYLEREKQLQLHTTTGGPAVFHGHGAGTDSAVEKEYIAEYFRNLDSIVNAILGNNDIPLILAGAEFLHPIYRSQSKYKNILSEGVKGNYESSGDEELHKEACKLMQPFFKRTTENALEKYENTGNRDLILDTVKEILPAAHTAAVKTLLIAEDSCAWAKYDPDTLKVEIAKEWKFGFEDLYELTARATYQNGGDVLILKRSDMPHSKPVVAILRYPYALPPMRATSVEREEPLHT